MSTLPPINLYNYVTLFDYRKQTGLFDSLDLSDIVDSTLKAAK